MSEPKTPESQETKPVREIDEQTQKHIDRFLEGREAWNKWAIKMLAKKEMLEKAGKWKVKLNEKGREQDKIVSADTSIPEIQKWIDEANVDFSNLIFQIENLESKQNTIQGNLITVKSFFPKGDKLDFSGFRFPGKVFFLSAKFNSSVEFKDAIFHSSAFFTSVIFNDHANFRNVIFETGSYFLHSKFFGYSNFSEVEFGDIVVFRYSEFNGQTNFSNSIFKEDADFEGGAFNEDFYCLETKYFQNANFSQSHFHKVVLFDDSIFQVVFFREVVFHSLSTFRHVAFNGNAYFCRAKFLDTISFSHSNFEGVSDFNGSKFDDTGSFFGVIFTGKASFSEVDFSRKINFANTKFLNFSEFDALLVKRAFSLEKSEFTYVIPDFTQANFSESPRLDHVEVRPSPKYKNLKQSAKNIFGKYNWQKYFWDKKFLSYVNGIFLRIVNRISPTIYSTIIYFSKCISHIWNKFFNTRRNPDEEAHYRALKRLAIQAHDHENEMKFFAGEIRARRHVTDFANFLTHDFASSMRYWAGVAYELFSDFGRSFIRPALWWFACLWIFANLTLSGAGLVDTTKCHNSQLTPKEAAYTIGLKNSLLILGLTKTNIVKQAELCLYGKNKNGEVASNPKPYDPKIKRSYQAKSAKVENTKTDIPFKAAVQGIAHSLLSLLFIFLLLLAIRNQFKIK